MRHDYHPHPDLMQLQALWRRALYVLGWRPVHQDALQELLDVVQPFALSPRRRQCMIEEGIAKAKCAEHGVSFHGSDSEAIDLRDIYSRPDCPQLSSDAMMKLCTRAECRPPERTEEDYLALSCAEQQNAIEAAARRCRARYDTADAPDNITTIPYVCFSDRQEMDAALRRGDSRVEGERTLFDPMLEEAA